MWRQAPTAGHVHDASSTGTPAGSVTVASSEAASTVPSADSETLTASTSRSARLTVPRLVSAARSSAVRATRSARTSAHLRSDPLGELVRGHGGDVGAEPDERLGDVAV